MAGVVPVREDEWRQLTQSGWASFKLESQDLLAFAQQIGIPVPSRRGGELIQRLRVEDSSANRNSLTTVYGSGAFPYHTDGAYMDRVPRYVLMSYNSSRPSSRPTLLKCFSAYVAPEKEACLRTEQWLVDTGGRRFYAPLLSAKGLRIDPQIMKPVNSRAESPKVLEAVLALAPVLEVFWAPGDALLIDNWRVVHARAEGRPDDDIFREIRRVLISDNDLG